MDAVYENCVAASMKFEARFGVYPTMIAPYKTKAWTQGLFGGRRNGISGTERLSPRSRRVAMHLCCRTFSILLRRQNLIYSCCAKHYLDRFEGVFMERNAHSADISALLLISGVVSTGLRS